MFLIITVIGLLWSIKKKIGHYLPDIEIDLSGGTPNVPKVSISHLPRTVNNATHNCNLMTLRKKGISRMNVVFLTSFQESYTELCPLTETPGRCDVFSRISALISWRSNNVLPQDGHETYSCNDTKFSNREITLNFISWTEKFLQSLYFSFCSPAANWRMYSLWNRSPYLGPLIGHHLRGRPPKGLPHSNQHR